MLSAQQARSGIPSGRQSVLPTVRGVPWWGAVLIAGVPTVAGATIDAAADDGLAIAYRVLFFLGCVAAVLTVRRRALFTAVTQPPLIAFVVALITLGALNSDSSSGLRNFIINVMLPIAKTFPLMAWTFVAVGLLAAGRWYLTRNAEPKPARARSTRSTTTNRRTTATTSASPARGRGDSRPRPRREPTPRAQTAQPAQTSPRAQTPPRATVNGRAESGRQFSPRADGHGRRPRSTVQRESPARDLPQQDRPRGDHPPVAERLERYRGRDRESFPPIPRARYRGVNP